MRLKLGAMPDAYFEGNIRDIEESTADMEEKITDVLLKVQETPAEGAEYEATSMPNNRDHCIHQVGSDQRESRSKTLSRLASALSDDNPLLPISTDIHGPTSRVAMLFTLDLLRFDAESATFDFRGRPTSSTIDDFDKGKEWVLDQTAEIIARSLVLPCLIAIEGDKESVEKLLGTDAPRKYSCFYLNYELSQKDG